MRPIYNSYIHEYTDKQGRKRFAVAEWDERNRRFVVRLDRRDAEIIGYTVFFADRVEDVGGYLDRRKALRRARYVYGQRRSA